MSATAKHPSVVTATEQTPLLESEHGPIRNSAMPKHASIDDARRARRGQPMPQTIGHRGFKGAAPENTMAAFRAATETGVDAVETDLHLTRDGVIVLCHDETLERCYGNKSKVRDLDWSEISQLRTLREPHEPMPRLIDLLEYLDQPKLEDVWLMLDIKTHDDAEEMMRRIAETLASVPSKQPWNTRVTPCCWTATYIRLSMKYLPDYPITHLGFSTSYARCLTHIPNISFSMLRYTLASPSGGRFLRDMKELGIPVYVWTVDEENWMEWSIRKQLSGVITDEVALFHEVCDRVGSGEGGQTQRANDGARRKAAGLRSSFLYRTIQFWGEMTLFQILAMIFLTREFIKGGSTRHRVNKALNG
ncbi:PLC-like phosphodiesterase [Nemania sp. NC0429]|nr:PLC-like phosphodiesterase [Nemania sp. NC0429]